MVKLKKPQFLEKISFNKRIFFAIICILFNSFGVPCFVQKRVWLGVARLLLGIFSVGIIGILNTVKGIIMGIKILKMTDAEYEEKKGTFLLGIPTAE